MKEVIVRLANGLGNQLFIYAAAYVFAKKNNIKLFVDNESGFYKRYKYELHNFNITTPLAEKNQKFARLSNCNLKWEMLVANFTGNFYVRVRH